MITYGFFDLFDSGLCKGRANELRVTAAFNEESDDVPLWISGVKNASPRQDRAGIDVYVETDIPGKVGRFYIQIKSSERSALIFRQEQQKGRYSKKISVVVIQEDFSPEQVRRIIIQAIMPAYYSLLTEFAGRVGANFIPA